MTDKEKKKIEKLISQLDTVTGKLLVPSMRDKLVEDAMKQVSFISFELTNML